MAYRRAPWIVALALAIPAATACTREAAQDSAATTTDVTAKTDRAADLQRERDRDIAQLTERVAEVERKYERQVVDRPRGTAGATAGLREEVQEDVKNVRRAVDDLKTTTTDNWWERHEQAMHRTADDIEADVRRMSGARALPEVHKDTTAPVGEASSAPFTSRRDRFVKELRARIESWDDALKKVSARGARETELDDVRARIRKLDDDLDRLDKASADDWWDVTNARVSDYIDRVEKSVARLDDNPADTAPKTAAPRDNTPR
jgi:predicted ribosome quality control (RQC) complex YloA/Tae2 family protein